MAADYYQRSLQGAMDKGTSIRNGLQSRVDQGMSAGKDFFNNMMGIKEVKIAPGTPPAPPDPVDAKSKELISNMVGVFETGKMGGDPVPFKIKILELLVMVNTNVHCLQKRVR